MATSISNHSEDTGQLEGEVCRRNGCDGVIRVARPEGCSCHIDPPCSACTEPREYCPDCDWCATDDEVAFNGFLVRPSNPKGAWSSYRPRPLDSSRIDWHSSSHTNSSMVKDGVFPFGTTKAEVENKVRGTFGGRFERFYEGSEVRHGSFKYIAYTD